VCYISSVVLEKMKEEVDEYGRMKRMERWGKKEKLFHVLAYG
jgi:hypothetical protein